MNLAAWSRLKRNILRRWWLCKADKCLVLKGLDNNLVMEDTGFLRLFDTLHREGRVVLSFRDQYSLFWFASRAASIGGAFAELGVFRGGSAKLIAEAKGAARLHLFDTFEGMPEPRTEIDLHRRGDFGDTSLFSVQEYLRHYENVSFHPGHFPETAESAGITGAFSLVHLDADIYESTLDGLRFFFPRLSIPGFILVHDAGSRTCPGVRRALNEFFVESKVMTIPLWDSYSLIVKH